MAHQILYQTLKYIYVFWSHLVMLKANWTGRTVPSVTSLPSSCYMTQNYSRDFCRPGRPTTVPDDIRAQEVNSKRFWRENWWLVAFGYSVCCRVSNAPRLKASTRTHHNRADARYFPVLELLQPYNALGCLLSRGFWILTCFWVHRQLPL